MEPTNWAPEHSDALREFLTKGLSFAEVVKQINSKFDTAYSRSAALGRARRMGLMGEDRPKPPLERFPVKWRPVGVKQTRIKNSEEPRCDSIGTEKAAATKPPGLQRTGEYRSAELRTLAFQWPAPVCERVRPRKLRCVEVEPRHLSVTELECGDCRYPYGGDAEGEAITFCGHPRRSGSSYCTPHFHLSRNPIVPPELALVTAGCGSSRRYEMS